MNKISIKSNEDSKSLFNKITVVKTCFNTATRKISKEDKITVVLNQECMKENAIKLEDL